MSERDDDKPPTQKTLKGVEIPVPSREDFLRDLRKVAPKAPKPPEQPRRTDTGN